MLQTITINTHAGDIVVDIVDYPDQHDVYVDFRPEGYHTDNERISIAHVGVDHNEGHKDVEVQVWNNPFNEDYTHTFRVRRVDMVQALEEIQ